MVRKNASVVYFDRFMINLSSLFAYSALAVALSFAFAISSMPFDLQRAELSDYIAIVLLLQSADMIAISSLSVALKTSRWCWR